MGFAKDFLWGAASASYQIEGAPCEDGKCASIWDAFSHQEGKIYGGHNGDVACDAYHRYGEDLDLLQSLGIRNYRLSLSWCRVMPSPGQINEKGLAYYDRVVDGCLERGIEPWITLYHWDLPQRLQEAGGWRSRATAEEFALYAQAVARHFKGRVRRFFTLNEPQCAAGLGYMTGEHAPGLTLPVQDAFPVWHHLMQAHGKAALALRQEMPGVLVGLASTGKLGYLAAHEKEVPRALSDYSFHTEPGGGSDVYFNHHWALDPVCEGHYPDDSASPWAKLAERVSDSDLDEVHQRPDFLGLNIYNGHEVAIDDAGKATVVPRYAGYPRTAIDWPVTPQVLYWGPRQVYERYGLPIVISENGLSCTDTVSLDGKVHDPGRIDFLHRYLLELQAAARDGADIAGYLHWALTDNFEWANGYKERFGLIYIDYRDGKRIPKDSARWYAQVVRSNGESLAV